MRLRPARASARRRFRLFAFAFALAFALPARANAQAPLTSACPIPPTANAYNSCLVRAQAAAIAQPRLAIAAAGGAPLLGSASTLGMRIRTTPRLALQLRAGGARLTLPAGGAGDGSSTVVTSFDADGAVAILGGLSPLPTIGGVGSLDLLGSLGVVHAGGAGLSGSPSTFGIGARLGLLRESFTVPGISVSAMVRRTGSFTYTSPVDNGTAGLDHLSGVALRATAGKRFMALGTMVGIGVDHTSSRVTIPQAPCPPGANCVGPLVSTLGSLGQDRANFFADLTWTSLVVNAIAELGWQRGGDLVGPSPTGFEAMVRQGALFGSLGLRLTI